MKYVIAIPDGASDQLSTYTDGKTPLYMADTPTMDELANKGFVGWSKTVPENFPPGSDVATLSIFGFNPEEIYTGRAPLEAANMGVDLRGGLAFRCNLVTITDGIMKEFTAGHISTEEAIELIHSLNEQLQNDEISVLSRCTISPYTSYSNRLS
jgi:2,3-bisphosphoglycerate-independent phosphoglycerate mutase